MLRLSVTHLESLRWNRILDQGLDELIADLTYSRPKTPKMLAGGALARLLENTFEGELDVVESEGWTFDFSEIQGTLPLPQAHELKVKHAVQTSTGQVILTAKVDGVFGLEDRDQKLSEKFEPENYIESWQWRAYLWMTHAQRFVYDVFVGKIDEERQSVLIKELHSVAFYAYPRMAQDVIGAVDELAAIVRRYRETRSALRDAFPELPDEAP